MGFTIPGTHLRAPNFETQTDRPPPWIDCTWEAAEMAVDFGSGGRLRVDSLILRRESGDKVGGSTVRDVHRGIRAVYGFSIPDQTLTKSQVVSRLDDLHGGWISGRYEQLPAHFRRWSPRFKDGHAIFVRGIRKGVAWWMDPLGRGKSYRGEEIKHADLLPFLEWPSHPGAFYISLMPEDSLVNTYVERQPLTPPQRFVVAAGTTVVGYSLDRTTATVVEQKRLKFANESAAMAGAKVKIVQTGGVAPTGDYLEVVNGAFAGLIIPARAVALEPGPTPDPVDCSARVTAATAPLYERLARIDVIASEVPA